jgi:hypothetical protein
MVISCLFSLNIHHISYPLLILTELISDEEITEATALKLREAINYDEMVIVDSLTD